VKRLLSWKNGLVAAVVGLATNSAFAAVDTTAALAELADAQTAIIAVGGAIIVLAGVALGIRWVKATFF